MGYLGDYDDWCENEEMEAINEIQTELDDFKETAAELFYDLFKALCEKNSKNVFLDDTEIQECLDQLADHLGVGI